jgi:hypothetical protein
LTIITKKAECCKYCKHVFFRTMIYDLPEYYCHEDQSEIPPVPFTKQQESLLEPQEDMYAYEKRNMERINENIEKWKVWSYLHEVDMCDTCPSFEKKE